ncbi:MAG: gamma-glutamyltransferase [Methylobacteriaceae bacterium]|nr:gamma-glutamyltransferase [Methylobacteriaceae bacterium]
MSGLARLALALALAGAWCCPAGAFSRPAVEAKHGMVVTSQRLASEVGVEILQAGGNAIDAAVAVGYVQAVVNPCCGNIGGGGFMVIRLAGGLETFVDFRETAPAAAKPDMYLDAAGNVVKGASLDGYKAVAVPGTVLGLDTALRKYGRLSRATVMAPAIRLARDGFVLTRADTDILEAGADRLRADPVTSKIFLRSDGSPLQPGDRLVQTELADTLAAIARDGPDAFYKGAIASAIAVAANAGGGILTAADLANYRVAEETPISCTYRGFVFLSAPPPSSGGVALCEILNVLEGYDMRALGFHSARAVHLMVEAMRHAYLDRNTYLGDPGFVQNPLERLLSKDYAASIRARIDPDKVTPSASVQPGTAPHEKAETTHFSVLDQDGNAVSVTYTLNGIFGSGVMAPGTGFLLNDEMDDFTVKPGVPNLFGLVQGKANEIAPGKRPLSSMAPTIVTKDRKVAMVLGSPGGSRIISIVLEAAMNIIDYDMQPQEAVDAPRIHHQWLPDTVFTEPFGLSPDTLKFLQAEGYAIKEQAPWGAAEMIVVGREPGAGGPATSGNDSTFGGNMRSGYLYGASDDRRPAGAPIGY